MIRGKLELKDINPIVSAYSYSKVESIFGEKAAEVAKLMGVKKSFKPSKSKKDKEEKGED